MSKRDLRTQAIVLNRTKYAEADRVLTLLTPNGRKSVIAKSVRKEKSKLAGGIELFCVSDVVIHQGHGELGILTSAKMLNFYSQILSDFNRLDFAAKILKKANKISEQIDNTEIFSIVKQGLVGIDHGLSLPLIEAWLVFQFTKVSGEEINLHLDCSGNPLLENQIYFWDHSEQALRPDSSGTINQGAIKFMRLLWTANLATIARVAGYENFLSAIQPVVRNFS